MSKFGSKKVERDGYWFSSMLECSVYGILKLRQAAGEIEIIKLQDSLRLARGCIWYIADFKCLDLKSNEVFWVEAKGNYPNHRWPTVKRAWKEFGPGILQIYMGSHQRPFLKQTIVPKDKNEKA